MEKIYDEEQTAAINAHSGYYLVLAPPGCGKTDILSERVVQVYQGSNLYEMSMRLYTKEELKTCIQQIEDLGYRMLLNNDNSPWFDAARCRYLKFQHRQRPAIAINEYDYYEVTLDE